GSLRIMLMNFRQTFRKLKFLIIQFVRWWQLYEIQFRKNLFHLWADKLVQTIVIVYVQKPAAKQVFPQVFCLLCRENNITMTCQINKRIVEQIGAAHFGNGFFGIKISAQILVAKADQVG